MKIEKYNMLFDMCKNISAYLSETRKKSSKRISPLLQSYYNLLGFKEPQTMYTSSYTINGETHYLLLSFTDELLNTENKFIVDELTNCNTTIVIMYDLEGFESLNNIDLYLYFVELMCRFTDSTEKDDVFTLDNFVETIIIDTLVYNTLKLAYIDDDLIDVIKDNCSIDFSILEDNYMTKIANDNIGLYNFASNYSNTYLNLSNQARLMSEYGEI